LYLKLINNNNNNNIFQGLAATAALLSFINVFGGFVVTQRMLQMFKRYNTKKINKKPVPFLLKIKLNNNNFKLSYNYNI